MNDLDSQNIPVANQIIGREPSWMIRFGISTIFVFIIVLICLSYFLKYPDTIKSKVNITSTTPPIALIARQDGTIEKFFFSDGDEVKKGQSIALLDSEVNFSQFKKLQISLDTLANFKNESGYNKIQKSLQITGLGELQPSLNSLISNIREFNLLISSDIELNAIENTTRLKQQYLMLISNLNQKKSILLDKENMTKELINKNRSLNRKGHLADSELLSLEYQHFDNALSLEDIDIQLNNYNIRIKELEQNRSEFEIMNRERKISTRASIMDKYHQLLSDIEKWQRNHLLVSPIDGTVSLLEFWSVNQHVNKADTVATIVKNGGKIIGKMLVPSNGIGKVKKQHKVKIELSNYPSVEFGYLEASVLSISLVSSQKGYVVDVVFPNGLVTTYKKNIPFIPNLAGTGKIITNDRRLIERLFDRLLHLIDTK